MILLIKNVHIVDGEQSIYGNICIKDGIVHKVIKHADIINYEDIDIVIDGMGKTLMPSFIDMHTHLREPGYEYKETMFTGQKAALSGGYTILCPMANTNPPCDNEVVMKYIKEKANEQSLCDIYQISAVTKGLQGKELIDFETMKEATQLFSDDGYSIMNQEIMERALMASREFDIKILTHCQPESQLIKRDLKILEDFGGNLHICHVSEKESIGEIVRAKNRGSKFTCEVTPHHIFSHDLDYRVNPPIGDKEDNRAIMNAIKKGYIDIIATDHAPHSKEDKKKGSPGISNIEVAFAMVNKKFKEWDIELTVLSRMMSKIPGEILGLNSGLIKEGYEANLVLIDDNHQYKIDKDTFISKGKNTPFNDMYVQGKILFTMKRGKILYKGEEFCG
ncbi:dihydroorotase [Clostridiisalibacter paucivorans]|uniref:dihydroorotase n=1 Tax=Clostridiisalibacter paucivorans TaxID=408753 RepID=UPI00047BDB8E|nr:dihydroorotase [Clostridiisalibacter paucivorans]